MHDLLKPPVFLLGMPRSGTTWVAKILDSHPDVLYRHEPDVQVHQPLLPYNPGIDELAEFEEDAKTYISEMIGCATLRASGILPIFPKNYRSKIAQFRHIAFILGLRFTQKAFPVLPKRIDSIRVPTASITASITAERGNIFPVIKSVDSLTRARLFFQANPHAKVVHIIRHPCGYVSSLLRGWKTNKLRKDNGAFIRTQVQFPQAKRRGLTLERLETFSQEERFASLWMLKNEKVIEEMQGSSAYKLLNYDEFCAEPLESSRDMFEFLGLEWSAQSERFIKMSIDFTGRQEGYFQVVRNPLKAANKWKQELSSVQQAKILAIVEDSLPGKLFRSH